jgi:hypothetical protein
MPAVPASDCLREDSQDVRSQYSLPSKVADQLREQTTPKQSCFIDLLQRGTSGVLRGAGPRKYPTEVLVEVAPLVDITASHPTLDGAHLQERYVTMAGSTMSQKS